MAVRHTGPGPAAPDAREALHRDVAREAFRQLNIILDRRAAVDPAAGAAPHVARVTFQPTIVDRLVVSRPADRAALEAANLPGMSANQRKVNGANIFRALRQVAAYMAAGAAGGVEGFVLDTEEFQRAKRKRSAGPSERPASDASVPEGWTAEERSPKSHRGGGGLADGAAQEVSSPATAAATAAFFADDDWGDDGGSRRILGWRREQIKESLAATQDSL